jgi:4-hydroxythreonine-4-phosphate dehydrogenase
LETINSKPLIAITMGDPTGVGPEIILKSFIKKDSYEYCRPFILGDFEILNSAQKIIESSFKINKITAPEFGIYKQGNINIIEISKLNKDNIHFGMPDKKCGTAMADYIIYGTKLAMQKKIDGLATCPINKKAINDAGYKFNGHTELIANLTKTKDYAMMLTGSRLKVVLVTIHVPLKDVPYLISTKNIIKTIKLTGKALTTRFGIKKPIIAVAGLNPHAGEEKMFGKEDDEIIKPAIKQTKCKDYEVLGVFPPDTVFYNASKGAFDAVVCMYHDQGLIPFKLLHFKDGVNTTIGLPIIRTSVDHGTAYDIAGTGKASPESLIAAIKLAAKQARLIDDNNSFILL